MRKNERQAAVSMQVTLPPRDRLRLARRRYSSSSPSTRESHQPMRGYYRHTKIIATLGPATESAERLAQLILSRRRHHAPQHGARSGRVGHLAGQAHSRRVGRVAAGRSP